MKYKEIKELTTGELIARYKEEKIRLQKLKFNDSVARIEDPHQIGVSRKQVARMLTEINDRRINNEIKAAEKANNL
ncbi:MAG: 50S ribosomal protein L29 [Bacteroidia bacterium]|nr:50S ribosomal protein L29 [Bacteroidia bacterium]